MARTAITITNLTAETANAYVVASGGVAIDATNSHVINVPSDCDPRELVLLVTNTYAGSKTATVKAGVAPPAIRKGAGDLVLTLGDGSSTPVNQFVPLTGSRFVQADGTINVDIAASMTGRIAVLRIPRNV